MLFGIYGEFEVRAVRQVDPRSGRWDCVFCGGTSSDHGVLGASIQVAAYHDSYWNAFRTLAR